MKRFLQLDSSSYKDLISETAHIMKVQPSIIEKDIWVCEVLQRLFTDTLLKDRLVFKGGTSLSKVFNLINRFSEDIDLIIDWHVFGYGEGELDPYLPRSSKTKQDRFNKEIVRNAAVYLRNTFVPHLQNLFLDQSKVSIRISEFDGCTVELIYPSIFSLPYIENHILLEIGPLASWIPSTWKRIHPYVSQVFTNEVGNISINVLSSTAERTFWEKATILHQEAHRIKLPPNRYSRHYYDMYKMAHAHVKEKSIRNVDLLEQVVLFKQRFYPCKWAQYELAQPGTFKLITGNSHINELRKDYEDMKVMFFEDVPDWDEIVNSLMKLENEINNI